MATDVFSAKTGSGTWDTDAIEDIRNIVVDKDPGEQTYSSSSTSGQVKRKSGTTDQSGTMDIYTPATGAGPTGILPFAEGDEGALVLKSATGQTLFDGTAFIGPISWNVPIEGGALVSATVNFGRT